jgi:CTP-dependent riboflavin kinase
MVFSGCGDYAQWITTIKLWETYGLQDGDEVEVTIL